MPPKASLPRTIDVTKLKASICRDSFWDFVRAFWTSVPGAGTPIWNWHMRYLCEELQAVGLRVFRGEPNDYDLVINIAPGTSKSMLCSVLFHPWTWTFAPWMRHVNASHTSELVLDLANKARDVIRSPKYQLYYPDVQLRTDMDAKGYYANTAGGMRFSCTVSGKTPTGFHGHILFMDDPLDPQKALSEVELKTAAHFTTQVFPSRKTNKLVSTTITIQQRVHHLDPTGVQLDIVKKEGSRKIRHVCLPAELTPDLSPPLEELQKKYPEAYVEGLMDPVRMSCVVLQAFRATMSASAYEGQFLQKPVPPGGQMFRPEYFNLRVKCAPYDCTRIRYTDRACLVAGTQILTDQGEKSIEDVRAGDKVLTRQGYKRVEWSGISKYVNPTELTTKMFPNGRSVTGTADHKVWTENRGWVALAEIVDSDFILLSYYSRKGMQCQNLKDPSQSGIILSMCVLKEYYFQESGAESILLRGDGIRLTKNTITMPYIVQYGDSVTVKFQKGVIYIIKTRTQTIINYPILSASLLRSTLQNIWMKFSIKARWLIQSILRKCRRDLVNGGRDESMNYGVASIVKRLLRQGTPIPHELDFAPPRATTVTRTELNLNFVECAEISLLEGPDLLAAHLSVRKNTGGENVNCAVGVIKSQSDLKTELGSFAALNVHQHQDVPVYDLTVEDCPEFFANGVLVHNSTPDGGCRTAMVLLAKDREGNYYVEHVEVGQWEPRERNKRLRALALRDRARYPNNEPLYLIEREGGSSGRDAWLGVAKALEGFTFKEDTVTGDKTTRAEPWSSQLASGNVYIVDDGSWDINDYIREHVLFPMHELKDLVDACLIAGTKVETKTGPQAIETIQVGDYVLTRKGYKKVLWAGQSGNVVSLITVLFSNGSILTGTPHHPILTQSRGFIRLDTLSGADNVLGISENVLWDPEKQIQKSSCLEGSLIVVDPEGSITSEKEELSPYIEQSGSITKEIFPAVIRFTTKMGTWTTITSRTWNVLHQKNTLLNTINDSPDRKNISIEQECELQNGINQKKDVSGTKDTDQECGRISDFENVLVSNVERFLSHVVNPFLSIVPKFAPTSFDGTQDSEKNILSGAQCVIKTLWEQERHNTALGNAELQTQEPIGSITIPVFNLEVEESPEFYAEGILVHNSSGAFNRLVGRTAQSTFRILSGVEGPKGKPFLWSCTREELSNLTDERSCLLVFVKDPLCDDMPGHALQAIDTLTIITTDIQPKDYQDRWTEEIPKYGKKPEDLHFTREQAKKVWAFLMKRRPANATYYVFAGDSQDLVFSMSLGVAAGLGLKAKDSVHLQSRPDNKLEDVAPNQHVYDAMKSTRGAVM